MSLESNIQDGLYYRIIDSMSYGVIVANAEGEFIFWNAVTYKMFNKNLKESPQNKWVDDWGVYKIDGTKYNTEDVPLSRALKGETVLGEKLCIKPPEHEECIYIKVYAYPIYSREDTSKIEAGIVMFEDITKEQQLYDNVITKIGELENYLKNVLKVDYKNIFLGTEELKFLNDTEKK